MVFHLLPLSVLLSTALAAGRIWPGALFPGNISEFSAANQNSNYSHTVTFLHDERVDLGTWQWTLRVSEVSANDQAEGYFPGARAAYSTYAFAWPGQGTLNDALRREVVQEPSLVRTGSCAVLFTLLFPSNVTSKYDDSSSDCTSMLGSQCVNALKGVVGGVDYKNGECKLDAISLNGISSGICGDTIRVGLTGLASFATPFGNYSGPISNSTSGNLLAGQTFAYAESQAYSAGNTTVFDLVSTNVNILGLTGRSPTLICNRASSKGLQLGGSSSQGNQTGAVPPNSASGIAVNMALAMGSAAWSVMMVL